MIPFFRKIRKQFADDNRPLQYMRYAIGEIVLVVIGILIALQVNNWNENQKIRRTELKMLRELKEDLLETKADLLSDVEKASSELKATDSLYQLLAANMESEDPDPIDISMHFLYERSDLYPKTSAYESLRAHGINLISNDSLRVNITDFFELQLVRVDDLEKTILELDENELGPYLMRVSKATSTCEGCSSLDDLLSSPNSMKSHFYFIDKPTDELMHLLKKNYLVYSALQRRYHTTESKIESLIQMIDEEIGS